MHTYSPTVANEYVPFEYPEVHEFVPDVLPSHEFVKFPCPKTHKHKGKYFAKVSEGIYIGPFNSRKTALRIANRRQRG